MKFGSLFAGVGGLDLGFEKAGMRPLWQVEIDEQCNRVLQLHWPDVRRYGDITTINGRSLEAVDLICGGFPCQDVSVAGKRAGLAGERSGLWFEFYRILAEHRPPWVVIENVPGLLSSNGGRDFAIILRGLAELGYGVAWRILDAQHFGVPQRRRRVFIVGHLGDYRAVEVLLESESLRGDTAEGGEEGKDIAYALAAGAGGSKFGSGRERQDTFVTGPIGGDNDRRGRRTEDDPNLIVGPLAPNAGPRSHDAGNFHSNQGVDAGHIIAAPLRSRNHPNSNMPGRGGEDDENLVLTFESRYARNGRGAPAQVISPLKAQSGQTGKGDGAPLVEISQNQRGEVLETDYAHQLTTGGGKPGQGYSAIRGLFGIRRLMPIEAERLQGFPDGWTSVLSDSGRYRVLGNAVCVPVAEWIGRRILEFNASS